MKVGAPVTMVCLLLPVYRLTEHMVKVEGTPPAGIVTDDSVDPCTAQTELAAPFPAPHTLLCPLPPAAACWPLPDASSQYRPVQEEFVYRAERPLVTGRPLSRAVSLGAAKHAQALEPAAEAQFSAQRMHAVRLAEEKVLAGHAEQYDVAVVV